MDPVGPPADPACHHRRHRADDAEDADLKDAPAQHAAGIDAAKAEKPVQRIAVQHRRAEVGGKAWPVQETAQKPPQIVQRRADIKPSPRDLRLAHPQEERHHEDRIPDGTEGADRPRPLAQHRIKPEKRRDPDQRPPARPAFGQERQHQDQRHHPAKIAKGKARPRYAADLVMAAERGQQRIGEDRREFHADQPEPEEGERPEQPARIRREEPQPPGAGDIAGRKEPDPDHAPPALVGDRAEDRGEDGDEDAGDGQPSAPIGLRRSPGGLGAHAVRFEMRPRDLAEIGGEDEGQQQGVVRLAGPVEEIPAPDPLARRYRHCLPFACRAIKPEKPPACKTWPLSASPARAG